MKDSLENLSKIKEYSFGHNFVKDDESGMVDTPFCKAEIEAYLGLLNFLQVNGSCESLDRQKNNNAEEENKIIPIRQIHELNIEQDKR
ncbi:4751_t:CDS:2, partial [Entrophospora sp. SA101]